MQASLLVAIINQRNYELKGGKRRVRQQLHAANLYKTLQKVSRKTASFISRIP